MLLRRLLRKIITGYWVITEKTSEKQKNMVSWAYKQVKSLGRGFYSTVKTEREIYVIVMTLNLVSKRYLFRNFRKCLQLPAETLDCFERIRQAEHQFMFPLLVPYLRDSYFISILTCQVILVFPIVGQLHARRGKNPVKNWKLQYVASIDSR